MAPLKEIKKAACDSINNKSIRYSSNAGLLELRKKLANSVNQTYGVNSSYENIIVTVGGMEALYLALLAILNIGDEVIIFAPYYVNYVEMVKMCGAKPVIIWTTEEGDFEVSKEEVLAHITEKTKAIVINNPNNPTGHIYSERFLSLITEIAEDYKLYLLSDEVYKDLVYEKQFSSPFESIKDNLILIDSFSKKHCMTGWRIGYAVGADFLIGAMTKLQENIAACAPVISQYAAIEALNYESPKGNLEEFRTRRDLLLSILKKSKTLKVIEPQGAFYAFVNIAKTGMESMEFCEELLKEYHVAVAPGIAYGQKYDDYIRIAFTLTSNRLKEGLEKLVQFAG